jgi:hypothetical protein
MQQIFDERKFMLVCGVSLHNSCIGLIHVSEGILHSMRVQKIVLVLKKFSKAFEIFGCHYLYGLKTEINMNF